MLQAYLEALVWIQMRFGPFFFTVSTTRSPALGTHLWGRLALFNSQFKLAAVLEVSSSVHQALGFLLISSPSLITACGSSPVLWQGPSSWCINLGWRERLSKSKSYQHLTPAWFFLYSLILSVDLKWSPAFGKLIFLISEPLEYPCWTHLVEQLQWPEEPASYYYTTFLTRMRRETCFT